MRIALGFVAGIVVLIVAGAAYAEYALYKAFPRGPNNQQGDIMDRFKATLAKVRAFLITLDARVEGWWRSTASSVIGAISVATGLFTNGATALHDLGVAEAWIKHIAAALIVAGLVLVTPREKRP